MTHQTLRSILSIVVLLFLAWPASAGASLLTTQPSGFPLPANTAFCEPGYAGPFVDCTPWEGVTVSFASSDGSFATSCVTSGTERAAGCVVDVPFGSVITASIDPAVIPAGYTLEGAPSVEIVIPDGPPQGEFGGATFVLFQVESPTDAPMASGFPLSASTAYCDPGYAGPFVGCEPWQGVAVSFETMDGSLATSCVTTGTERAAGCVVEVPFGSTVIASIDPGAVPAGYVLEQPASQQIVIPNGPPEGEFGGAAFVLLPAAATATEETAAPTASDTVPIEPAGMPAAIYAGSCGAPLPADPVAQLDDVREATGAQVGSPDAVPVATSYTELDVPFAMLADGTHVIAVFGSDNAGTLVSCGAIGGSLADGAALAIGLLPEGEDGYPAVAYITPLDGGTRSSITVFVTVPPEPSS